MEKPEKQIKQALTKIDEKKIKATKLPKAKDYVFFKIKEEVLRIISLLYGKENLDLKRIDLDMDLPPEHVNADLSLELFNLSKILGIPVVKISKELGTEINKAETKHFERAQSMGPYLNLFLKKETYGNILLNTKKLSENFGKININKNKLALIDFSSPNIAKPMGVGHLRSTVIGQAVSNIYEATGYAVIKDNHVGDWGTQFGKLIYAYQTWGDEEAIAADPIRELNKLYVRFGNEAEANPELEEKAREIFKKLESGDKELIKLWKEFSDLSVKEFNEIYKIFGVEFDLCLGESFFAKAAEEEVQKALNKNLARKDEDSEAIVVDTLLGVPSFLLRKQDGSTLYISRDLATLKFRTDNFKPDVLLYIVGEEQKLNFSQLFELAKHMGYLKRTEAKHIDFGLVMVNGEKMSTRKGTLVELNDLISQSIAKAKQIIAEKENDISEKELEDISEIVGVGAIIYNDLRQSRSKNITFEWGKMLDFEGGSAVYLQYTYARAISIMKKSEKKQANLKDFIFESDIEFDLAKKIMMFPKVIVSAQRYDAPHVIAVYLEELAQIFNSFYNSQKVLSTENEKMRDSRLELTAAAATVIKNGLSLLNIKVSDKI